MIVAIVGSREYKNPENVIAYVRSLPIDTIIVSGGAKGVDTIAEHTAEDCGLYVVVLRADWKKYGKRAGAMRNRDIVDLADQVVAFWDGQSAGTSITIEMARKAGKLVEVMR